MTYLQKSSRRDRGLDEQETRGVLTVRYLGTKDRLRRSAKRAVEFIKGFCNLRNGP